jgi:hypothetical protein
MPVPLGREESQRDRRSGVVLAQLDDFPRRAPRLLFPRSTALRRQAMIRCLPVARGTERTISCQPWPEVAFIDSAADGRSLGVRASSPAGREDPTAISGGRFPLPMAATSRPAAGSTPGFSKTSNRYQFIFRRHSKIGSQPPQRLESTCPSPRRNRFELLSSACARISAG